MYAKASCSLSTVARLGAMETKRQKPHFTAAAVHPHGRCFLNARPARNSTNRRQVRWMRPVTVNRDSRVSRSVDTG